MKTIRLKELTRNGQLIANRRAPVHRPTRGHKNPVAYNRKDKSWKNE